ncbi:MAG: hypothetical protein AAF804_15610, partial [Bacteroidota bacterium]
MQSDKTILTWTLSLALFLACSLPGLASAQVSKDEAKFWKQKAKMYKKDPMALKTEFENYQQQIEDLKSQVKELMENQTGTSDEEASLRMRIIELEN